MVRRHANTDTRFSIDNQPLLPRAARAHARDLILLSATPHQGDHFRFWMLVQVVNSTLFKSPEDMVKNRHRLNVVVFRRTKADACRGDGSPLFARRWVHTESFTMNEEERIFYTALREYLEDGFALAKRQGSQGRALGFVMTIFQKIAASSFAAVRRTLRRRILMLTLHEAIIKDQQLDIDARQRERPSRKSWKAARRPFICGKRSTGFRRLSVLIVPANYPGGHLAEELPALQMALSS